MRRTAILLIGAVALCVGTAYAAQGQGAAAAFIGATRWQPWRAPVDTSLSAAQAELTADLIRHVEMTVAIRDVRETFRSPAIDSMAYFLGGRCHP